MKEILKESPNNEVENVPMIYTSFTTKLNL